jgi:DNA-binding transcriptional regulator YiaG
LARPRPSEEAIAAQAADDGNAWTDEELTGAEPVYPPSPEQVWALRAKLGLTQAQFAPHFGFTLDTVQQTNKDASDPPAQPRHCFG